MERIDDLEIRNYKIYQDSDSFCFGIDAVLLANFALRNISSNNKSLEFKFNAKILNPTLTAKDAGLYPNAYIIYK